jgi:CheY-like chemotaxis protein
MGGRAALDLLRDLDPDVRAVAASGYSDDPVMADPEGFGFRAAIPKPFRPDELARALAPLLRVEKSR